jgi:hypothetical protein
VPAPFPTHLNPYPTFRGYISLTVIVFGHPSPDRPASWPALDAQQRVGELEQLIRPGGQAGVRFRPESRQHSQVTVLVTDALPAPVLRCRSAHGRRSPRRGASRRRCAGRLDADRPAGLAAGKDDLLLDDLAVTRFLAESVANSGPAPDARIVNRLWSPEGGRGVDIDPVVVVGAVSNVDIVAGGSGHRGPLRDLRRFRADMQWRTEGQGNAKAEESNATVLCDCSHGCFLSLKGIFPAPLRGPRVGARSPAATDRSLTYPVTGR